MLSASWYVGSTTSALMAEAYDAPVADEVTGDPAQPRPERGPTALPGVGARVVAFVVILVGGLSGLLIGMALVQVQCHGDCGVPLGLGALVGGVGAALGVSVIAVLVLRAMGEWQAGGRDASQLRRR